MADKRINALTTTSASVGDDYFAIDGATNGTRALSAFSPTFGGNVVVTGTLTSNSTLSTAAGLIAQNADFNAGYIILRGYGSQDGGLVFFGQSANNNFINSNATTISTSIAGSAVSNNVAAGFRVLTTTASTSTSSGALVVSGGVGVAGAINAGGTITSTNGSGSGLLGMRSSSGNASYVFWSETGVADRGILGFNNGSSTLSYRSFSSSFSTGTEVFSITSGGNVTAIGATHSLGTSASSGTSLKVISGVGTLAAPKYSTLDFRSYNDLKTGAYIRTGNRESDTNEWLLEIAARSNADVLTSVATFGSEGTSFGASPSTTGAVVSATGTGTSGATRIIAHLENNFATAALNNAAQLRFKVFNNSVGDGEIAAINGISDSVTPGARTTALSFLTGQQTVGVVERMRISGAGTVSLSGGLLTISKSGAGSTLEVNADSGYDSKISLQRAATNRWTIECDSSDTLRFKSLGSTQIVAVTSSNLTFSGDLLFFANSTYDIGTTANRVRQIFVRDIYSTFYTPASATDTGTAGRICYDSNYIYICTATNTWKRAAISTW